MATRRSVTNSEDFCLDFVFGGKKLNPASHRYVVAYGMRAHDALS